MKFAPERSRKAALRICFQLDKPGRRISASEIARGRRAGQLDVVQYQLQNSCPFHWGRSIGSWLRAGVALYLGLVVLGATVGLAQDNEAASEESGARQFSEADYVVDFWRTEQGLPHNTVNAILQTRDGYLWVGTAGGLVRFDGLNFTLIGDETAPGLRDARVTALLEDRHGVVWVGT
jgi:hypothetical protein